MSAKNSDSDSVKVEDLRLTPGSHELFMAFVEDAGNWNGNPYTDGNVNMTAAERGNLTQLKKAGLLDTQRGDDGTFVLFTERGQFYASLHGGRIYDNWVY